MEQPKHPTSSPSEAVAEIAPAPSKAESTVPPPGSRTTGREEANAAVQGKRVRKKKGKSTRIRKSADEEARRIVRAEMARRDFSYKQLVIALERLGHKKITEGNLISRISRGTFTFAFAIDVLRAMGATVIDISPVNLGRGSDNPIERDRGR